jgi:hypothetical protein
VIDLKHSPIICLLETIGANAHPAKTRSGEAYMIIGSKINFRFIKRVNMCGRTIRQ